MTNPTLRKASAADIEVPGFPPTSAQVTTKPSEALLSDTTATFRRLRALQASCGSDTNKHDIVAVLIVACITEGFDIKPRIIGALMKLGFSNKHVACVLDGNPATKWRLEGGIYVLQP